MYCLKKLQFTEPDKENNANSTNLQSESNVHSRSSSIKNRSSLNSNQRLSMEQEFKSVDSSSVSKVLLILNFVLIHK